MSYIREDKPDMAVDAFWAICNFGILASTLFTFHDHACDSEKMRIRCPVGTTVDIQWAQYGRQVPSQQMCPHIKSFWPGSATAYPEDTNCLATTSLQIVLDKCQDQQQCRLRAVAEVFGQDPCPGTSKYLEVAYKCRPKEFRSRVTCEGEQMVLECQQKRTRLAVYSAMYGRGDKGSEECPAQPAYNTECHARCALEVVMKRCHGKRRCSVRSSDSVFGNPCHPQTPKYLSVVYTCVPRRILKEMAVEHAFPYSFCDEEREDSGASNSQEVPWEEYDNGDSGAPVIDGAPIYESKLSTMRAAPTQTVPGITYTVSTPMAMNETLVTPDVSPVQDDSVTFITDWLHTWDFIRSNKEKFILYLILSILVGFIILLLVIIIRLAVTHHRLKKQAKLEITDPVPQTTSSTLPRHSSPDRPEDVALLSNQDMLDSSDRLEILNFQQHPHSYQRNHYSTTPRTFGNPNNNNNAATLHSGLYGGSGIMTTSTPYTNQYRTSPNRTNTLPRYESQGSQGSQGSRTFDNYYR